MKSIIKKVNRFPRLCRLQNLTITLLLLILLGYEIIRRSHLLVSLTCFLYFRWIEVIHPNRPVTWLTNYHSNEEIWKQIQLMEEYTGERPNILLILADDLGVNDISGGLGIETPFIDSIAKNGLNFTQAYSSHATCAPSRAALFTGRYPTSIGYEFTPVPRLLAQLMGRKIPGGPDVVQPVYHNELFDEVPEMWDIELPHDVSTMPELFREIGYRNYLLGKKQASLFFYPFSFFLSFLSRLSI
jgi:hypothetical protein